MDNETFTRDADGLPTRSAGRSRGHFALVVVGVLELITLTTLVLNLITVNKHAVAQAVGPIHGCLYLIGIALTWSTTRLLRARLLSIVPAVGSLFAAMVTSAQSQP